MEFRKKAESRKIGVGGWEGLKYSSHKETLRTLNGNMDKREDSSHREAHLFLLHASGVYDGTDMPDR